MNKFTMLSTHKDGFEQEHRFAFDIATEQIINKTKFEPLVEGLKLDLDKELIHCKLCSCEIEKAPIQVCDNCFDKFDNRSELERYLNKKRG